MSIIVNEYKGAKYPARYPASLQPQYHFGDPVTAYGPIIHFPSTLAKGQVSVTVKGQTWTNLAGAGDTSPQTVTGLTATKTYLLINSAGANITIDTVDTETPVKITGATEFDFVWASGNIALYELSTAEAAETAATLGARYHYTSNTKSTLNARLVSVGKNLFDKTKVTNKGYRLVNLDGSLIVRSDMCITPYIQVAGQGMLYFYGLHDNTGKHGAFYDRHKNYISGFYGYNDIAIPSNAVYVRHSILLTDLDSCVISFSPITSYEPYKESQAYLNTGGELRSLPNGTKDELNVTTGVKTQRVGNVILDGDEDYTLFVTGVTVYRKWIVNWAGLNNYTSHLEMKARNDEGDFKVVHNTTPATSADFSDNTISTFNNNLTVYLLKSKVDVMPGGTIEEKYIAYLNQHPITLTYQLAGEVKTAYPPGQLACEPNGTLMYLPELVDQVEVYDDGITIDSADDDEPILIKSVKSCYKIDTGTGQFIQVALADITVAGDGLSFTIAGASNGERYIYRYEYDWALSTVGITEYSPPAGVTLPIPPDEPGADMWDPVYLGGSVKLGVA